MYLLYYPLFFALGASYASFLYYLWPHALSPQELRAHLFRRSRCDHCQKVLPLRRVLPFSALVLKGRSHCCNQRLNPRYMACELFGGTLFIMPLLMNLEPAPALWVSCAFLPLCFAASYDVRHQHLPHIYTILGFGPLLLSGFMPLFPLQGVILALTLWGASAMVSCFVEKPSLGGGDLLYALLLGSLLTLPQLAFFMVFAGSLGLFYTLVTNETRIPLGACMLFSWGLVWILRFFT